MYFVPLLSKIMKGTISGRRPALLFTRDDPFCRSMLKPFGCRFEKWICVNYFTSKKDSL